MSNSSEFFVRRPLMGVWTAALLLDCSEDSIIEKIDSGCLPFAWDIASPKAQQRHIRVLSRPVYDLQHNLPPQKQAGLPEVIDDVIGSHLDTLSGTDLRRIFHCSSEHVLMLIRTRCLKETGHADTKQTPRVSRESLVRFLSERRIV